MNRRRFAAFALLGVALPLVTGASRAQQANQGGPAPTSTPAAAAPTAGPSATELAARVQAFYNNAKTFKADFKQRYHVAAYNKTQVNSGSVIFEKPGKMSWRYANNGNRVVSDGKIIRIYEQSNRQMFEQALSKTAYPDALSFLTGQGQLDQIFKLTKRDSTQMRFPSGYVLEGEPLQPTATYDRVFFYIDGPTFQVRRIIIVDAQHNRNSIDFLTSALNTRPPAGEFVFAPPRGTQIIRPSGIQTPTTTPPSSP
jgi:outer membrane lipoprotein carrier protein